MSFGGGPTYNYPYIKQGENYVTASFPLINKGVVARYQNDRLPAGTYLNLNNWESREENSLSTRYAAAVQISPNGGVGGGQSIMSLARMKGLSGASWRYAKTANGQIFRRSGITPGGFTSISSGYSSGTPTAPNWLRMSAIVYRPNFSSAPYVFFADANKMSKDNGSLSATENWGIAPPTKPVATALGGANFATIQTFDTDAGFTYVNYTAHAAGAVVTTTIAIAIGSTGLQTVTPAAMTNIVAGQLLIIDSGNPNQETVLVLATSASTFTAVFAKTHGAAVTVGDSALNCSTAVGTSGTISWSTGGINLSNPGGGGGGALVPAPSEGDIGTGNGGGSDNGTGSASQGADSALGADTFSLMCNFADPTHVDNITITLTSGSGFFTATLKQSDKKIANTVSWQQLTFARSDCVATGAADWSNITACSIQVNWATGATSGSFGWNDFIFVGGAPDSTGGVGYDWRVTYFNINTGEESNPSVAQVTTSWLFPKMQQVTVTWEASTDTQVTHVRVYRRGGLLPSAWYMLDQVPVGTTTFTDQIPDSFAAEQKLLELDNDQPASATLPVPVNTSLGAAFVLTSVANAAAGVTVYTGVVTGGAVNAFVGMTFAIAGFTTGANNGTFTCTASTATTLTLNNAAGVAEVHAATASAAVAAGSVQTIAPASLANIYAGQKLTIGTGVAAETVIARTVTGSTITAYFQLPHTVDHSVYGETRPAQPMHLAAIAFEKAWLAGDPNNPHILYYSKSQNPSSFPPQNQLEIGTPGDPIMALAVLRGQLFVFTMTRIYGVTVVGGLPPIVQPTAVKHGLAGNFAWCIGEGVIYYLAKDGPRVFTGGSSPYLGQDTEWIWTGKNLGPIQAMDVPNLSNDYIGFTTMAFYHNEVYIAYQIKVTGQIVRMIYHTVYQRWRNDAPALNIWAMLNEEDIDTLLIADNLGDILQDRSGDTDSNGAGGTLPFTAVFQSAYDDQNAPKNEKNYAELWLDLDTGNQVATVKLKFNNGDGTVADFVGTTNTGVAGRKRVCFNLGAGAGVLAYNASLQVSIPVTIGPAHVYNASLRHVVTAERRVTWDTYWQDNNSPAWKFMKQGQFMYEAYDAGGVTVNCYLDGSPTPAFTFALPQALVRREIKVRFPALKHRVYRFVGTSNGDFKMWGDSFLEWKPVTTAKGYSKAGLKEPT